MSLCLAHDVSELTGRDCHGECARGVKVGGQRAAPLVAEVVRQAGELAGVGAGRAPRRQLRLHQRHHQLLRLDARQLHCACMDIRTLTFIITCCGFCVKQQNKTEHVTSDSAWE